MGLATDPYLQYKQNAVQGASPGELTLMLYDGLVKFLKLALISMEQNDFNRSNNALIRSQEIVAYLNDTLDYRYEISQNLSALYDFMSRRLVEANTKKDAQIAAEVLELAEELRDTWQQAMKAAADQR
ncbi:MAG: flagellar export chaperone FliS [Bacillota bacterium]